MAEGRYFNSPFFSFDFSLAGNGIRAFDFEQEKNGVIKKYLRLNRVRIINPSGQDVTIKNSGLNDGFLIPAGTSTIIDIWNFEQLVVENQSAVATSKNINMTVWREAGIKEMITELLKRQNLFNDPATFGKINN